MKENNNAQQHLVQHSGHVAWEEIKIVAAFHKGSLITSTCRHTNKRLQCERVKIISLFFAIEHFIQGWLKRKYFCFYF